MTCPRGSARRRDRAAARAHSASVDVAERGTGDGADVRPRPWLNNNCQQWQLQPV